jgi:choline dehydrogenase-like flavoprotein
MADTSLEAWVKEDRLAIGQLPVHSRVKGLPEKRAYGSDFPFRDLGQRAGLSADSNVNDAVVSGAYGGFSNVWGAQVMPFTTATFRDWPVTAEEMHRHYAAVLEHIPYAAEDDDLSALFPLLSEGRPLPRVSARTAAVLGRYERRRSVLRRRGILMGRARLAMDSDACVLAGLCMTGCPYSLIYSASQTLDALRKSGVVEYYGDLLAVRVGEDADGATVVARELATGTLHEFKADRVILGCGAIGTSRLVMGSLGLYDTPVDVAESVQFMLPFISRKGVEDPRRTSDFTLNQFNMALDLDDDGYDVSHLHFYTYNPSFEEALPAPLKTRSGAAARTYLLRRLSLALGYLPSWASPSFRVRARPAPEGELPALEISGGPRPVARNPMLRATLRRLTAAAPALDLWPVLPMLRMAAAAKSYHWGGLFAHADRPQGRFVSDPLGRVAPWERIHLADGSVFPTVAATTFTLTVMANAHRIASNALQLPS